jgi:hypothetical protein
MTTNHILTAIALALLAARVGYGHGQPIVINSNGQQLTISDGMLHTDGYATQSFDHSEDGQLYDVFGTTIEWSTPGIDRTGSAVGLPIELQILPRPDFSESPIASRWLWHWSAASEQVELTADARFLAINSELDPIPNTFKITRAAGPSGGDSLSLAFLHHPVTFALDNSLATPPGDGVYGFFARLRSPELQPSEPFLVALNYNLSLEAFADGAAAINRAAGLPGDYDLDLDVDGNDFLVWQRSLGSSSPQADGSLNGVVGAEDLAVWDANFGRSTDSTSFAMAVPESNAIVLLVLAGSAVAVVRRGTMVF